MWTKDDTHEMSRPQSFHRRPLSFHLTAHQPAYCPAMSASTSIVVNLNYFLIGVEFMLLAAHVFFLNVFLYCSTSDLRRVRIDWIFLIPWFTCNQKEGWIRSHSSISKKFNSFSFFVQFGKFIIFRKSNVKSWFSVRFIYIFVHDVPVVLQPRGLSYQVIQI
jgi:hypothetical protein